MEKETDKTAVRSQSHPTSQSSYREDIDKKDASKKRIEKRKPGLDDSELETFWRSYIA